ncbi:hypothetical protein O181_025832 [Austropuccinia psidii MF-1]|uniref:Helicase C-terminal domain-containing protein n=1 Tax=Austropuccinia psidii MF-1 TaxID=1389203 RepID=A0A9Q3H094_9BASI|nr:hypothetical protein [Austropuccinia psidii MF-1]
MQTLTLRRLKANLLDLPKKVQHGVGIEIYEPWKTLYFKKHEEFSALYGKQRSKSVKWDSSEFFFRLSDLRQLCNHPALIEREEGVKRYTWKEGSKVVHLVSHLKEFFQKEPGLRYPKAVVFSEYKRFLDIIEIALDESGISNLMMHGMLKNDQRIQILEEFRKNPKSQVLLTTKGTGGVGIDLRCAQNVYIMEPGWNPSTDEQAVDRLYRLGQKKEVHVFHYITVGSIEVNIQQVRRKKQQLQMLSIGHLGTVDHELEKLIVETIEKS